MYLRQANLFNGVSMSFIQKVMDIAVSESLPDDAVIFHAGDTALHFFILINGRVKLTSGEKMKKVFIGHRAGEFFGWSGLTGRDTYSAAAKCLEPTNFLKINCNEFRTLLNSDVSCGQIFYRNLASVLGSRLIEVYELVQ